jgi:hypothetical protein
MQATSFVSIIHSNTTTELSTYVSKFNTMIMRFQKQMLWNITKRPMWKVR